MFDVYLKIFYIILCIFTYYSSQFDSGVFSDNIEQVHTAHDDTADIVIDKLDMLDRKISAVYNKKKPVDKGRDTLLSLQLQPKYSTEDLEVRQMLLRKLIQFRNKRTLTSD